MKNSIKLVSVSNFLKKEWFEEEKKIDIVLIFDGVSASKSKELLIK